MKRYSSDEGVSYLRRLLRTSTDAQFQLMRNDRDAVLNEYGYLFRPDRLDRLGAKDVKGFLLYENNRHWWGIHRHQAKLVADMPKLRAALAYLLDDREPLESRINWIEGVHGSKPVPGLGPAVYTPILHVVYPDAYGVWNTIAAAAMTRLGLWPILRRGVKPGERYAAINRRIVATAATLETDLWTLDSLWWLTEKEHEPTKHQFSGGSESGSRGAEAYRSRATSFFTCERCFQLKAVGLRFADTNYCVDCT